MTKESIENLYNEYSYLHSQSFYNHAETKRMMLALEESAKDLGYRIEHKCEEYGRVKLHVYRLVGINV